MQIPQDICSSGPSQVVRAQARAWLIEAGLRPGSRPLEGSTRDCQLLPASLSSCWNSKCVYKLESSTLEVVREVLVSVLHVVQRGVDLVQHGVGGCPHSSSCKAVDLAFHAHIYRHALFHLATSHGGLVHGQGSRDLVVKQHMLGAQTA